MSATLIGFSSRGMPKNCRPPGGAQPPWPQATFSPEDFEDDEDEDEDEEEDDEDEAVLFSPDVDEDLSPLPDLSPPLEDDEDESAEDPAAVAAVDAGSEAVDPFLLSVR
jgi:hypothetical protein